MHYSTEEMMVVAAARVLKNEDVCFVGIGMPSVASNLARLTHAPNITLIYESGTIETKPDVLPLSIGDPELSETALTTVSVPEMFQYWLQGGRISIGFLGGAQLDRFGNINSSVIGSYDHPKVRLPGGGGAPEIASLCHQTFVVMRQSRRSFVERVDFITSFGYGNGGDARQQLGISTLGPTLIVTDLCLMQPETETKELIVTSMHQGVTREDILQNTGWPVRFADIVNATLPPTETELVALRDLHARTKQAHTGKGTPSLS